MSSRGRSGSISSSISRSLLRHLACTKGQCQDQCIAESIQTRSCWPSGACSKSPLRCSAGHCFGLLTVLGRNDRDIMPKFRNMRCSHCKLGLHSAMSELSQATAIMGMTAGSWVAVATRGVQRWSCRRSHLQHRQRVCVQLIRPPAGRRIPWPLKEMHPAEILALTPSETTSRVCAHIANLQVALHVKHIRSQAEAMFADTSIVRSGSCFGSGARPSTERPCEDWTLEGGGCQ